MLEAFEPTASDPWDASRAAHLARRAGFGARPAEVARLVELGPAAAVDSFVDFDVRDAKLEERLENLGGDLVDFSQGRGTRERVAALARAVSSLDHAELKLSKKVREVVEFYDGSKRARAAS